MARSALSETEGLGDRGTPLRCLSYPADRFLTALLERKILRPTGRKLHRLVSPQTRGLGGTQFERFAENGLSASRGQLR